MLVLSVDFARLGRGLLSSVSVSILWIKWVGTLPLVAFVCIMTSCAVFDGKDAADCCDAGDG